MAVKYLKCYTLSLQPARAVEVAGGLPVPLLRAGGLHHQQRHDHPQPRGPRAVEERVPAERVRAGEQGVHRQRGGHRHQGLGRHGHDRQLQVMIMSKVPLTNISKITAKFR